MILSFSEALLFTAALPFVSSSVLPILNPRDQVYNDVIRWMKCEMLYEIRPTGGWEQGMAAWYDDRGRPGAPNTRIIFPMNDATSDFFSTLR